MIGHSGFEVEPWAVRESRLDLDMLAQTESVFALSNGMIGLRANFDEGEPFGLSGTYLNGFFETRPLPYAEAGYGYPEAGQTLVNVTNGKIIRLLVNDEPFDIRYGELKSHERVLDLRDGTLRRSVEWVSPTGEAVRIRSTRLVSFAQRAVAAVLYEVEPLDEELRVVLQSELVANEPPPSTGGGDPRAASALTAPLCPELSSADEQRLEAILVHRTRGSDLRMAAGFVHTIDGPDSTAAECEGDADLARALITSDLIPGQTLRVVKFLAYGWSSVRSVPAMRDQVAGALAEARLTGWDGLLASQKEYLGRFWKRADIEIEGDDEIQQAVRYGLFQVLQAGARVERRAIAAKGLTGPGYDGHAFWDSEQFVLPVLTYTVPEAARDALRWRHSTLPQARDRAEQLGLDGAAFPWRTIDGAECSGYWPAGTAAFHVNADIADAARRYVAATGDQNFKLKTGLELLIATARLWFSLGQFDRDGGFRIDGVTGPDEYTAIADNNIYTNLMARRNLSTAADWVEELPAAAEEFGAGRKQTESWREAAESMVIPFDEDLGVHQQSEGFTDHAAWDFERTSGDQYPLLLHFPYFDLYRKQVVKQADLVLALHLCGDFFDPAQKERDFAYYEGVTVRDSSLSACTQAVVAAETGHIELAWDYLAEAALMDLDDLEANGRDGIHIASLAGAWLAVVAGLGGMRDHDGALSFAPRLPKALDRLCFRMCFLDRQLEVEVRDGAATYRLNEGDELELRHHGEKIMVTTDEPASRPLPPPLDRDRPKQPPGRGPARHPYSGR